MFELVWKSEMYGNKIMYWYYDFDTKELKVMKRKSKCAYPTHQVDVTKLSAFEAMFKMSQRQFGNSKLFGVELYRNGDRAFYAGSVMDRAGNNLIMLSCGCPIVLAAAYDNGFKVREHMPKLGLILVDCPISFIQLIISDKKVLKEVIKYMQFTVVRVSGGTYEFMNIE